jgi:hypothetical protein
MRALVIRSPWIDLILEGKKTWEMRTKATKIRGRIALIKAKSGLVYGTAELAESLPPLDLAEMREKQEFHAIPDAEVVAAHMAGWTTPWVLRGVQPFPKPIPYKHPKGAVTWVDLPYLQEGGGHTARPIEKAGSRSKAVGEAAASGEDSPWVDICLTDGNLRNNHFYLRSAEAILPTDCIGGSNRKALGKPIRVTFNPGMSIECDVAGDKMILRERSAIRDFFERSGAQAGGMVRLTRIGSRDFELIYIP